MANEISKKRCIYIYKMFNIMQWPLVLLLAIDIALCIYFSAGTSGYWGGGLAAEIMLLCTAIQSVIILKTVKTFDKDELTKRKFYDTFNWQGLNLILTILACIAGIACSAALGASYAKDDGKDNDEANSTQSADTDDSDKHYVNINENRTAGTILAILSALALVAIVRLLCLHGEVRAVLGIPEKPDAIKPAPQARPTPQPAANTNNGNGSNTTEIQLLTTQNNLLKEQNNLQKQQLQQITTLTHHLQSVSGLRDGGSIPPPPDYRTLCSPPPGYAFPDAPPPEQNK